MLGFFITYKRSVPTVFLQIDQKSHLTIVSVGFFHRKRQLSLRTKNLVVTEQKVL